MANYFWVALGGALGSMARYWLSNAAIAISMTIPWGTIIINVLGSFVIGWFATLSSHEGRLPLPTEARVFVIVGICGGFTTFSAFSLQTFGLIRSEQWLPAFANIALSVILCVGATALGHLVADRFGLPPLFGR
jgi:CrcB protein